jgi:predicted transcriptional regulator
LHCEYKITKIGGTNAPETPVSPSPNLSPPSIEHIEMMITTSERKNNRGKIQIMGDVLALGTSGIRKTHIMYKANLSYEQVHLYLGELIGKRLIQQDVSQDGVVYRTTEKGREFLLHYTRVVELLEEEEESRQESEAVGLSSPYISRMSWRR